MYCYRSLVPRPPPSFLSLAVQCKRGKLGEGLGTRLLLPGTTKNVVVRVLTQQSMNSSMNSSMNIVMNIFMP